MKTINWVKKQIIINETKIDLNSKIKKLMKEYESDCSDLLGKLNEDIYELTKMCDFENNSLKYFLEKKVKK